MKDNKIRHKWRYKSIQRNDSEQCRKGRAIVKANGTVFNFEQHIKLHTV